LCPAHKKGKVYQSVVLTAIEIRQKGNNKDGIHWKLLTTLTINNGEEAKQCMRWYSYRWLIERFSLCIKERMWNRGIAVEKKRSH